MSDTNKKTIKLLSIGNSFSVDSDHYLCEIAKSMGVNLQIGNLYIGGCTVDRHLDNLHNNAPDYVYFENDGSGWKETPDAIANDAIKADEWDYISMQQASGTSGVQESYKGVPELTEIVRNLVGPKPEFMWHMTWAYQGDSEHGEFVNYNKDQLTMYKAITDAVNDKIIPLGSFSKIIPCGTAVQNARTSFVGDHMTRDGFHMALPLGRYVTALTFFSIMTGMDISDIEFAPEGISEEEKKVAIESVKNAVANPFEVTQSKYK